MTEDDFLEIVRGLRKQKDSSALDATLDQAGLDSLDLLDLREELETRLGLPLSDEKFVPTSSLRDLYEQVTERSR